MCSIMNQPYEHDDEEDYWIIPEWGRYIIAAAGAAFVCLYALVMDAWFVIPICVITALLAVIFLKKP